MWMNEIKAIAELRTLTEHEEALRIAEESGEVTDVAVDIHSIGTVYYKKGELKKALTYFERAHEIFRKAGHAHAKIVVKWIEDTKRKIRKK